MSEIVNLRAARKALKRTEDKERAAENRALHGRTKTTRAAEESQRDSADRHIEGHRRDSGEES